MKELTEILSQELETFNRFMVLLDKQHQQLINRDVDGLVLTNSELDLLCNKTTELERCRQGVVMEMSQQMKIDSDNPKLSDLLVRLDNISSDRLKALRQAILDIHSRIERKSAQNRFLIDKSRNLIAESMKILTSRPSPIYQKPQSERVSGGEGKLVNRSA
jgi:hypothetical protein